MRTQMICIGGLLLAGLAWSSAATAATSFGRLDFQIRDVATGYGVAATVTLYPTQGTAAGPPAPLSLATDAHGRARYKVPAHHYLIEVSAQGYVSQRTHDVIRGGSTVRETVMMDPQHPPDELRRDVLESKFRPGFALVYGYVVDAATLMPLANVRILVREAGVEDGRATTDTRGYYEVLVPVQPVGPASPAEAPYALGDVLVGAPGYKKHIMRNAFLIDGSGVGFNVDMDRGEGHHERNVGPSMYDRKKPNGDRSHYALRRYGATAAW